MRSMLILVAASLTFGGLGVPAQAEERHDPQTTQETMMTASGTFDVKTIPQEPDGEAAGPFARLLLDKAYHGELEATSKGQMIAFQAATQGSAGYVALELVTGTLDGRTGSFALQHDGLMKRGVSTRWNVLVVPDSGTEGLAGIHGQMTIVIEGGKHSYEFGYGFE